MEAPRTTPSNYHGTAVSWAEAARFLCREGGDLFLPSRFTGPACFVTGHAWELALKVGIYAFSRDATSLRKLGHDLEKARTAFSAYQPGVLEGTIADRRAPDGTPLSQRDMEMHFSLLAGWHHDYEPERPRGERAQYFDRYPAVLGAVQVPALLPLADACLSFLAAIELECRRATMQQIEVEKAAK